MKKVLIVCVFIGMVFSFVGCASTAEAAAPAAPVEKVVLGADGIPQPDWVYKTVSDQDKHYEAGYGKMSDKQISIKRATVEAKNKIAAWVSTSVKEVIVTYVNDAGSGDDRQTLDAMETISEQVAEATLSGVTTEELWMDAEGGAWVLCSISLASIEQRFAPAAETVAEAFAQSDASDAAQVKMKDSFAALLKNVK